MSDIAQDLGGVVLLPCPFCGYDMTDEEDGVYQKAGFTGAQTPVWEVCCGTTMCNASVTATSRELAIAAWNTRAHSAEIGTSAPYPSTTTRSALAVAGVHE